MRISWSVTAIEMVLGKRNDLRSAALGNFSGSMLKMIAESVVDAGVPGAGAGRGARAIGSGPRPRAWLRSCPADSSRRRARASGMPAAGALRPGGRRRI